MAATPNYLGMTNGFLPAATGQAVTYVRDPNKFQVNKYAQLIKCPKPLVAYAVLDPDAPVRRVTDAEFAWPDNQPRPRPQNTQGDWVWNEVRVNRRNYGYTVGEQALETADWPAKAFFNGIILSLAMTNLTKRFIDLAETTGNWSGNTSDAGVLNGLGTTWANASNDPGNGAHFLAIKKSLLQAVRNILLLTNSMVSIGDLRLVISPDLAITMAATSEIHSVLQYQEKTIRLLKGDEPEISSTNQFFGLPEKLYGLPLIIEDAAYVNQRPNSAHTYATIDVNRFFVKAKTSAIICSRVGGLDGVYGAPNFSTFQRYFYKYYMAIEAFHEVKDKLFESHVVDQFKEILAATRSGWLITNAQ